MSKEIISIPRRQGKVFAAVKLRLKYLKSLKLDPDIRGKYEDGEYFPPIWFADRQQQEQLYYERIRLQRRVAKLKKTSCKAV